MSSTEQQHHAAARDPVSRSRFHFARRQIKKYVLLTSFGMLTLQRQIVNVNES